MTPIETLVFVLACIVLVIIGGGLLYNYGQDGQKSLKKLCKKADTLHTFYDVFSKGAISDGYLMFSYKNKKFKVYVNKTEKHPVCTYDVYINDSLALSVYSLDSQSFFKFYTVVNGNSMYRTEKEEIIHYAYKIAKKELKKREKDIYARMDATRSYFLDLTHDDEGTV